MSRVLYNTEMWTLIMETNLIINVVLNVLITTFVIWIDSICNGLWYLNVGDILSSCLFNDRVFNLNGIEICTVTDKDIVDTSLQRETKKQKM